MREIKFRAWDKGNMIMCGPTGFGEPVTDFIHWNTDRYELMQFTGLLDKNGKEIYEGDRLRWEDSGDILEVRWIDASWQVFGSYNSFASHKWEDDEIIGNIYENPNLLK